MRWVKALVKVVSGFVMILAGLLVALMTFGAVALGDCSATCQANGERLWGIGAGLLALGVAGLGGWLVRRGFRERAAQA